LLNEVELFAVGFKVRGTENGSLQASFFNDAKEESILKHLAIKYFRFV